MRHDIKRLTANTYTLHMMIDRGEVETVAYRYRKVDGRFHIYRAGVWVATII